MYSKREAWGFATGHKKALDVYFLVLLEVDFLFFPQQLLLSVRLFAIFQCLEKSQTAAGSIRSALSVLRLRGKKGIWKCTQHTITTRQWWKKSRTFDHRKLPLSLFTQFSDGKEWSRGEKRKEIWNHFSAAPAIGSCALTTFYRYCTWHYFRLLFTLFENYQKMSHFIERSEILFFLSIFVPIISQVAKMRPFE